ncbi:hypothetical protein SDC9_65225 [bioreactor metagenome]|uniref:Uncharacterized protein n=1 Tax=bioreactor metagenome TaxID=1076179 RepID=A0A644XRV4_9ZZZZ
MTRNVELGQPFVYHLGIFSVELVDDVAHGVFVPGYGRGGDDDPVSGQNIHLAVGGKCHPGKGGHGLALASRSDDADFVLGQGLDLIEVHQDPLGYHHIPQLGGDLDCVFHAAPGNRNLAAIAGGHVDYLLDPVHVGGEGGDDDPLLAAAEQDVEAGADAALALGVAFALHIGGVAQQGKDPFLPQLSQAGQVHHSALDRGGIDFKVAGMHADTHRAADGKTHRVRDGMVGVDKLDAEFPRSDSLSGFTCDNFGTGHQMMLFQLELYQAGSHAGGINGHVHVPKKIGQGPDVVLMAVG